MKKYKYGVIGSFVRNKTTFSGQAVKTRSMASALENRLGKDAIYTVDTYGWKHHPLGLINEIVKTLNMCEEVVILPADRGVYVIPKLIVLFRGFRKIKVHYVVIGGWLQGMVKRNKSLAKTMRKMHGIYVETNTMKNAMEEMGFKNIAVMPNFKQIASVKFSELTYSEHEPLKICTFSRVMKEKGIDDIVEAVNSVNRNMGYNIFTLDIYGKVDSNQTEWFEKLQESFGDAICYKGAVPPERSVQVLKDYFALIFPTRYYTEGIPGTVIDAYAAGIPVISAKWESFTDVIDDGITGIGYDFGDIEALKTALITAHSNIYKINLMKENCLEKAKVFDEKCAIDLLTSF